MASCLDIITYAMRQSRIIGPGKSPKAAEAAEGMIALQSLYDQWRTGGMFGKLCDVYLTGDANAQEGKRYYIPAGITLTAATSAYTPECQSDYGDGYSSTGSVRQPRDLALYETLNSTGTQTAKLYDRTEWIDLAGLELSDVAPLSGRNAYGLAACLATSGAFIAMFGGEPGKGVINLCGQFQRGVMSKFGSTQDAQSSDYF